MHRTENQLVGCLYSKLIQIIKNQVVCILYTLLIPFMVFNLFRSHSLDEKKTEIILMSLTLI